MTSGKLVDDDAEEEEYLSEGSKLKRKKCNQELDQAQHVAKEAEVAENEARDARVTLKIENAHFPPWSMERILNEAIDNQNIYWLEPFVSFELENTSKSQFDFPITLKAFLFRCFEKVKKASISDDDVNHMLFSFYLKHEKPQ
ncbi:unnamed protein product [Lactuca saligna]|uniref:Uncharacterized protein n=1 Tax=Lactuca saligna TaxID=75948 RepID=A0AA36E5Z7_LACSI|nr:unnamed protein product [Lactuca saligna]